MLTNYFCFSLNFLKTAKQADQSDNFLDGETHQNRLTNLDKWSVSSSQSHYHVASQFKEVFPFCIPILKLRRKYFNNLIEPESILAHVSQPPHSNFSAPP